MEKKEVTLDLKAVNQLKIEEVKNFSNAIFREQYESATFLLGKIISANRQIEINFQSSNKYSYNDKTVCNIIPFLGGRGTGKSSAMLSFSNIFRECNGLKRLNTGSEYPFFDKVFDDINVRKPFKFLLLDCIDASLLGSRQGLIEVVLAEMWDYFKQATENGSWNSRKEQEEEILKSLLKLKEDYTYYRQSSTRKDIPSIKHLHQLASTMNFRDTFCECVERFLAYFAGESNCYLVLMLDDIDMAGEHSFEILEQLHQFLCIPRIIILLTADPKRLNQICGNYYQKIYTPYKSESQSDALYEQTMQEDFVEDYLEKIIPSNMRVIMPDMNTMPLLVSSGEEGSEGFTIIQKMLNQLFQMGIPFDNGGKEHHFWEERSLRASINRFYSLVSLNQYDTPKEHAAEWVLTGIKDHLLKRVNGLQRQKFSAITRVERYDLNSYVIKIISELFFEQRGNMKRIGKELESYYADCARFGYRFGDVLYGCYLLEEQSFENRDFVNVILAYYTWVYYQSSIEERKRIFGQSLWGNLAHRMFVDRDWIANVYVKNGWDNFSSDLIKLEIKVTQDELKECVIKAGDQTLIDREKFIGLINNLLYQNKRSIMIFQAFLSFFDNVKMKEDSKDIFFHFSGGLHSAPTGREILKTATKGENSSDSQEVQTEEETESKGVSNAGIPEEIDSFKIIINPNVGFVNFSIDYPLLNTVFFENMMNHFQNEFLCGFEKELKVLIQERLNDKKEVEFSDQIDVALDEYWLTGQIATWKNKFEELLKTESAENRGILPLENIQLIYNIGKKLADPSVSYTGSNMYLVLRKMYQTMKEEMLRYMEYYQEKTEEGAKYKELFEEFPVVKLLLDPENEEILKDMLQGMNRADLPKKQETDTSIS